MVTPRIAMTCAALALVALVAPSTGAMVQPAPASPRFELAHDDVLIDEAIPIVVSGLTPETSVTVRLRGGADNAWTSSATFTSDHDGRLDLTRMAPTKGSYGDVDPMGLFWSAERTRAGASAPTATAIAAEGDDDEAAGAAQERWSLTAEIGNAVVAQTSIRRRAVAADVRVTPVRVDGLVGTFYEPPGAGPHPAMLVLTGSGGGIPPPAGPAGGFASRGYAVLALAYFGVEGLRPVLSNIPLEYFGTALHWLATQPSVDRTRIGVVGASRGAELALLLGVVYPGLRLVVAYEPSNVVWRGCCDPTTAVSWTIGGRALATMSPPGRRVVNVNPGDPEIPVEKIHGPVILISGKDDGVWDSVPMAERIVSRLKRHAFAYAVESLTYEHAGHAITRPYASTMNLNGRRHPVSGRVMHLGGTPAGTARAREDSWRRVLAFVDAQLRSASPMSSSATSDSASPSFIAVAAAERARSPALKALIDDTRARAEAFVFLSGGAAKMSDEHKQQLLTLLQATLVDLGQAGLRFAVGDGGTQAGIMQAAGLARKASGNAFPLIGVAPAREITRSGEEGKTPIDPNHSAIVAVTSPDANGSWGSETETMYWLFARLADRRPSVTLVANGGAITLDEIRANVEAGRPMVLLAGSGRATDAVISLLQHTTPDDAEVQSLREAAQQRGLPGQPGLFHVFNLESGPGALKILLTSLLDRAKAR